MIVAYSELSVFVYLSYSEKHLRIVLLANHVPPVILGVSCVPVILKIILVGIPKVVFANLGFYFEYVVSVSFK
jgi:hypothetical protein